MTTDTKGLLLGLTGVVIFGFTLPATRLAVGGFDPVVVGIGRSVVAAGIAAGILIATRTRRPHRGEWRALIVTSLGVVIGFPLFSALAMQSAPASHGGVVLAVLPLTTALASVFVASERPSAGFWLCAIAGSSAVVVFALWEGSGGFAKADILLLLAVAAASIGYGAGGALSRALGGWQVICWALVIALPVTVPLVWIFAGAINLAAPLPAWAGFVYVALMSQLVGFFAWNAGMALAGVARVGQLQLLQTFVTLAAAALLLGERITLTQIGFALLVIAIVALGRRMRVERTLD